MRIARVKGFADVLPGEVETWQFVEARAREVFALYNFVAILEQTELFVRSLGESTDIVEKEMYTFADHDSAGTALTLRPEGTAGVVRAYVESGMYQIEPVRKLYYAGPMFRRERPQKGRLRQFYQIGAELLGRADALADAEVLLLLADFFDRVGLGDAALELNSLGCVQCRPAYRASLLEFLRAKAERLCENCRRRIERNPLRVLDCKEPACVEATAEAPAMFDFLCQACADHFESVASLLRQAELDFRLNRRLVRGLDYYCRTAFEWTSSRLGAQNAVAAGGRYDGLVEDLGGPPTPGVGFALGMERLVMLLGIKEGGARPGVYLAWLGRDARKVAFDLARRLRKKGVAAEIEGEERSLKSQMRRADKLRARFALIVGDEELAKGKAVLRDLERQRQEEIDLDAVEERVARPSLPD
jgi:histidyl-tRNA synthetase